MTRLRRLGSLRLASMKLGPLDLAHRKMGPAPRGWPTASCYASANPPSRWPTASCASGATKL